MSSRGVNKVTLVGNIGQDPEVKYTQAGACICGISVATSESWKDKQSGQQQERTEWHRVKMFGKLGEIAGEYLTKGSKVYLEGSLRTNKWQDQQGQDRYTTEVIASEMQMLDSKGDNPQRAPQQAPQNQSQGGYDNNGQYQAPRNQPAPPPQNQQQGVYQQAPNDHIPGFD